jgi:hypothetical protein
MNPVLVSRLVSHLRQPTTIVGLAWAVNTMLGIWLGHCDSSHAVPPLAGSATLILMQDSTGGISRALAVVAQMQQVLGQSGSAGAPAEDPTPPETRTE